MNQDFKRSRCAELQVAWKIVEEPVGFGGEAGTWLSGCKVPCFDRAVRVGGLEGRQVDG